MPCSALHRQAGRYRQPRPQPIMERMDKHDRELAEVELGSLLRECEAVVRGSSLSPSQLTLMTNRVAA